MRLAKSFRAAWFNEKTGVQLTMSLLPGALVIGIRSFVAARRDGRLIRFGRDSA